MPPVRFSAHWWKATQERRRVFDLPLSESERMEALDCVVAHLYAHFSIEMMIAEAVNGQEERLDPKQNGFDPKGWAEEAWTVVNEARGPLDMLRSMGEPHGLSARMLVALFEPVVNDVQQEIYAACRDADAPMNRLDFMEKSFEDACELHRRLKSRDVH